MSRGAEIQARAEAYEAAKAKGLQSSAPDASLFWLCVASTLGWMYFFDRWSDAEIDAALRRLAKRLSRGRGRVTTHAGGVAHLTSNVIDGGGHVDALMFWCSRTGGALVSSEWQNSAEVGRGSLAALGRPAHLCPRGLTPSEKVRWVYAHLAELRPSRLILYVNPNDVVSLTAAQMYRDASGAEIVFCDHADTFYWLGASLADRVVELRPAGVAIAERLRGVPRDKISLAPMVSRPRRSDDVSRASLGVPEDATVSVTISAYYKMRPDGSWNYVETINRLLDAHPRHHHLVVGHGEPADVERLTRGFEGARVRLLGRRNDIDALLRAADFMIESFPLMGGLARLDAMREGRPVVAISHPVWPFAYDTGAFPADYPLTARTGAEVETLAGSLIDDAGLRREIGESLRRRFAENFSEGAAARALDEALGGRAAEVPEWGDGYDAEELAKLLSPDPVNPARAFEAVRHHLNYAPVPSRAERLYGLAYHAKEALKRRLS